MSTRTFVLLESNTTGTGPAFADAARALGMEPLFLVAEPERYPFLRDGAYPWRRVDTASDPAVLAVCRELRAAGGLAGVASTSEYYVTRAARTARALGLPAPDPQALAACRNKERQRALLLAAEVPQPRFVGVGTVSEALTAGEEIGYPCVLKPVTGSGKVGVSRVDGPEEMAERAAALLRGGVNERGQAVPRRALVEELVEGPEFSCELFDGQVVGVTRKHLGPAPYFVEMGHDYPAEDRGRVAPTARAALNALSLAWGAAHVEVRVGPAGPRIVEVNPRLAGGLIPTLVRLATGVDLPRAQVARACGLPVDLQARRTGAASIRFLVPPAPGVLVEVDGVPRARGVPFVADVALYRAPEDELVLRGDFRDRMGHVVASGATSAQSARAAEAGLACLSVRVRRAPAYAGGARA